MDQLIILLTAITFFYIGKYSTSEIDLKKQALNLKRKLFPKKGVVIEYPSAETQNYEASGEAKVDAAREKLFKENFKL